MLQNICIHIYLAYTCTCGFYPHNSFSFRACALFFCNFNAFVSPKSCCCCFYEKHVGRINISLGNFTVFSLLLFPPPFFYWLCVYYNINSRHQQNEFNLIFLFYSLTPHILGISCSISLKPATTEKNII